MPSIRIVLLSCFLLSGFAGLVYEVVWSRLLVHVLGASLLAVSTVLSVFMAGLAAGAYLGGRALTRKNPLVVYALLELAIGLYALVVPILLSQSVLEPIWRGLYGLFIGSPATLQAFRLLLCILVLALPTVFMGATFTVVSRALAANSANPTREVGSLYALNTAGAVVGAVLSGFVIVPALGLTGSVWLAALTNFIVAAVVLGSRRCLLAGDSLLAGVTGQSPGFSPQKEGAIAPAPQPTPGEEKTDLAEAETEGSQAPSPVAIILVMAACTGALFMILEVTWTRFFSLVFGSTTYAFSIVLALVLAGIAAGSWVAAALPAGNRLTLILLSFSQLLSGIYLYASLMFVNEMPWWLLELTQALWQQGATFASAVTARALIAAGVILPPAIVSGAVFPLCVRLIAADPTTTGLRAGQLYAANTAGAIVGSWLAGFVLIPKLGQVLVSGMQASILIVALLDTLLGAILFVVWLKGAAPGRRPRLASAMAAAFTLGLVATIATVRHIQWDPAVVSSGVSFYTAITSDTLTREKFLRAIGARAAPDRQGLPKILFYREGLNTTVTVGTNPAGNVTFLKNDGKVEASVPTDPGKPAPYSDVATQIMLGMLPILVHPDTAASAFLIGFGSGTTAGAILANPEVERLTIAELEDAVVAAGTYFNQSNERPLRPEWTASGRVQMLVTDGRSLLGGRVDLLDIVVSQPADPSVNGMSDLFTREFWTMAASRLKPNGLMAQWIQLYSITPEYLGILLRTFRDAFPHTLMFHLPGSGELILIGCREPLQIDVDKLAARMRDPQVRRLLLRAGVSTGGDVLAMLVKGPREFTTFCQQLARQTGDDRINTDDNLLTEYELARQLFSFAGIVPANLEAIQASDMNLRALLSNYGENVSMQAETLAELAIAFAKLAATQDLKEFYEAQALRLAGEAVALHDSPEMRAARSQVLSLIGRAAE